MIVLASMLVVASMTVFLLSIALVIVVLAYAKYKGIF